MSVKTIGSNKNNTPSTTGATAEADPAVLKWSNLTSVSFRKSEKKSLGEILTESTALTQEQLDGALKTQQEYGAKGTRLPVRFALLQ